VTVDLVLHIGADKTGTTSLQQLLRHNRSVLASRGLLYPRTPGRVRHVGLGLYARPDRALLTSRDWLRGDHPAPAVFRRRLRRRLLREIDRSGASSVILSDEALYRMTAESIVRLRGLTDTLARSIRVVVYLRRQDEHLVSSYQQAVKVGEALRLEAWAERDFSRAYDFAGRLATWRDSLRPTCLVVRRFDPTRFPGGSLEQDFLDAAAVHVRTSELRPVEIRNESLGVEAVELLRILNLHRIENEGLPVWQISNRTYVRRLRGIDTGPQVTLPEADLDRFMRRWEDSNRQVAVEHLDDASGEPFPTSRRTADATTTQWLDPRRLDHYLELLEVPEDQHRAIREIAEREAGSRSERR